MDIGVYNRFEFFQKNKSNIERFTANTMHLVFVLPSLWLKGRPYVIKCVLMMLRSRIRTSITHGNFTMFTILFVNPIRMYHTFIMCWDVFKFFSVNRNPVVLGIQIDDMDRFAVLKEVFLTGVTIVFGVPSTKKASLYNQITPHIVDLS